MEKHDNPCKPAGGILSSLYTMELRHLKSFLAVAEELNFRRAAEKLYITQPPLTRQIQELEREMGVSLFERKAKRIILTEAGKYLRGEAKILLDHVDEVKRQAIAVQARQHSHLRIGFVEYVLQTFLPDVFREIKDASPEIGIELFEMSTDQQVEALVNSRIDVGFLRYWGDIKELKYEKLLQENLIAIYSPKLLPGRHQPSLSDLSKLPFIAISRTSASGLVECIEEVFFLNQFLPKVMFEGGQLDTICRLVSSGLGWAIVPNSAMLPYRKKDELRIVEIPNARQAIELGIAWRGDNINPNIALLLASSKAIILPLSAADNKGNL